MCVSRSYYVFIQKTFLQNETRYSFCWTSVPRPGFRRTIGFLWKSPDIPQDVYNRSVFSYIFVGTSATSKRIEVPMFESWKSAQFKHRHFKHLYYVWMPMYMNQTSAIQLLAIAMAITIMPMFEVLMFDSCTLALFKHLQPMFEKTLPMNMYDYMLPFKTH